MSLLANSNAIEDSGYNIQRSLRFRSSASAYLNRTFGSPTNNKIFTWSGWVKRGALGTTSTLIGASPSASNFTYFYFDASDRLTLDHYVSGSVASLYSVQVFRDPSAWYHIELSVDTTQATASNRVKMYVNGVQITNFSPATYPPQNTDFYINSATVNAIGKNGVSYNSYFDGYLAEVNFIDGQALTPSSFGQTDAVTGVWTPKKYTGTYGTNGFYLNFSDNTSATTLAYDKSGNGNNWTPNNISTTAGSTYDSMLDVPTLTSANAANFATLNPLKTFNSPSITDGNLSLSSSGATWKSTYSTIAVSSGKWYCEVSVTANSNDCQFGIGSAALAASAEFTTQNPSLVYSFGDGTKWFNGVNSAYGASVGIGDVIGCAFDADALTVTFYKNGTSQGTVATGWSAGTWAVQIALYGRSGGNTTGWINFGQRPFSYTPPTGFKALNTFNLPDPVIKKPNQYMDATIWTGDQTTPRSITNTAGFQPDLVWMKSRSNAYGHNIYDAVRGAGSAYMLDSSSTGAEGGNANVYGYLSAFNANGFAVAQGSGGSGAAPNGFAYVNQSSTTYVGWQWKKGATPGFDIVTYTGTGSARTVSHSLGVAPSWMIVKARNVGSTNWFIYTATQGNTKYLDFSTGTGGTDSSAWNNTSPTSSVFTVGSSYYTNYSGTTYVAYLFAEIAGFSKFGSYTGNGSTDGPFVFTNFQPKFVMIKRTDSTGEWDMFDTSRSPYNLANVFLQAQSSAAEASGSSVVEDILSNGFKIRGTDSSLNASGGTYIYACFASNPFKTSLAR